MSFSSRSLSFQEFVLQEFVFSGVCLFRSLSFRSLFFSGVCLFRSFSFRSLSIQEFVFLGVFLFRSLSFHEFVFSGVCLFRSLSFRSLSFNEFVFHEFVFQEFVMALGIIEKFQKMQILIYNLDKLDISADRIISLVIFKFILQISIDSSRIHFKENFFCNFIYSLIHNRTL